MGFARVALWDKHYALLGFKLSVADGLDEALGVRHSLWSGMDQLGLSTLRQRKGASTSFFAWELGSSLWSQAKELSLRHPDSFEQWCRHLRELKIAIISPSCAPMHDPVSSHALSRDIASHGVALWNASFSLDPARIALSSKSSGVFIDSSALGLELCSVLSSKFVSAGKTACSERIDRAEGAQSLSNKFPPAIMSGLALWDPTPLPDSAQRRFEPTAAKLIDALALAFCDAGTDQLEEAIKSDVALAFKFIALLNTPAYRFSGLNTPSVSSVRQGMMMLGRQHLTQWLSLLLLRLAQQKPEQTALRWSISARARLCENLARRNPDPHFRSQAFVCGMLSGLPAALGVSPAHFLSRCPLPTPIATAVHNRQGLLGAILSLAIECERDAGLDAQSQARMALFDLDVDFLNDSRKEAFQWAWACL